MLQAADFNQTLLFPLTLQAWEILIQIGLNFCVINNTNSQFCINPQVVHKYVIGKLPCEVDL
jgi:hypothetical protein